MIKWLAVTLVALYGVFAYFGQEDRRVERVRSSEGSMFNFSLEAFAPPVEASQLEPVRVASGLSESDAVAEALANGKALRLARSDKAEFDDTVLPAVELAAAPAFQPWFVTGTNVNLRAGPGTGNEVVAQLPFGTKAQTLSDTSAEWIEIKTDDGTAGWIFARFLSDADPG